MFPSRRQPQHAGDGLHASIAGLVPPQSPFLLLLCRLLCRRAPGPASPPQKVAKTAALATGEVSRSSIMSVSSTWPCCTFFASPAKAPKQQEAKKASSVAPHSSPAGSRCTLEEANKHVFCEASRVVYEEGFRAFWKGNLVTIAHRLPYSSISFYAYETYKNLLQMVPGLDKNGGFGADVGVRLFGGGLSGITAASMTYPLDLVRTRLAAQTNIVYCRGISHALYAICRDEGVRGLYEGMGATPLIFFPFLYLVQLDLLQTKFEIEPFNHKIEEKHSKIGLSHHLIDCSYDFFSSCSAIS